MSALHGLKLVTSTILRLQEPFGVLLGSQSRPPDHREHAHSRTGRATAFLAVPLNHTRMCSSSPIVECTLVAAPPRCPRALASRPGN